MTPKVVVTGLGAVTPLGGDAATTWAGLLAGASGVTALAGPEFADVPVRLAARVTADFASGLPPATLRKLDRYEQMAMVAAREAWQDAGLGDREVPGDRLAVSFSSCVGGILTMLQTWDTMKEKGPRHVSPFTIGKMIPDAAASWIALDLGATAVIETPVAACATGNDAIRRGVELIRCGRADVVVAGGSEAGVHPLILAAFGAMRALCRRNDEPERASRPFDKGRDGFILGEGGAVLVLESAGHAARRGARVYAEVAGVGVNVDGFDFAAPDPDGASKDAVMRQAMDDARLNPEQVTFVNAHAASTPQGDLTESMGIRAALGDRMPIVTAPKASMGHLMGGAGAAEAVITVLALHNRVVPPTVNLENLDDAIVLDVPREPRELPSGPLAALNNSFGLGGHNVVTAFTSR
ncbi:beta-ketoacyl-[acyl-carrier-protein] synthase family protein [Streptosporangiaceae bacterium NEAU-GS5]|nr:beta-ketoacyl-[acyl-carrier-protein] synthase family protein [Streptosporangiaceae bacterium NEAU-GS5]